MAKTCDNMLTGTIKCHREVRYRIRHSIRRGKAQNNGFGFEGVDDAPRWLKVCGTCDRQIGRSNLLKAGWNLPDAIRWEREPDMRIRPTSTASPYTPPRKPVGAAR